MARVVYAIALEASQEKEMCHWSYNSPAGWKQVLSSVWVIPVIRLGDYHLQQGSEVARPKVMSPELEASLGKKKNVSLVIKGTRWLYRRDLNRPEDRAICFSASSLHSYHCLDTFGEMSNHQLDDMKSHLCISDKCC